MGNPVLELACGTGRLTLALAAAGIHIVGVDHDPVMLAAARRRQREEQNHSWPLLVAADMRRFSLARRFQLVFVGYNSIQLLTEPGAMVECLIQARAHLAPGGLLGLEVTDFQAGGADGPEDGHAPVALGEAEGIRLSGTLTHDLQRRTSRYRRLFEGDGWRSASEVVVRSLDRAELEGILDEARLAVVQVWECGATVRALAGARTSGQNSPAG